MQDSDDTMRLADISASPAAADRSDASPMPASSPPASPSLLARNLPLSLDAYEKAALERALVETWGDAAEAARLLGIGRSTFYRKAGKHGINLGDLRSPAAQLAPAEEGESAPDPIGVGAPKTLG